MSDFERITATLEQLKATWLSRPTLRLGELLARLAANDGPLVYIEDGALAAALARLERSRAPLEADAELRAHEAELKARRFAELQADLARYATEYRGRFWVAGLRHAGRLSVSGDVDVLVDFADAIADEEAQHIAEELLRTHGLAAGVVYYATFFSQSERVARHPEYWIDSRRRS